MGLNLQAKQLLQEINTNLELISDPLLKVAGGKNYGDVLRLLGDFSQSEQVLEKVLRSRSASALLRTHKKTYYPIM